MWDTGSREHVPYVVTVDLSKLALRLERASGKLTSDWAAGKWLVEQSRNEPSMFRHFGPPNIFITDDPPRKHLYREEILGCEKI